MWITHAKNDPAVPEYFSNTLFNRLKARGAKDIHYSLYDNVVDTSGLYKDELGKPYEYHGHFSWIYALNNECGEEIEGKYCSLFEWLAKKSKG
jgi:hypothetical protein